jgi:hypothetical protein
MKSSIASLVLLASLSAGTESTSPRRRPLEVDRAGGLYSFDLDAEIFRHAGRDFTDLRILSQQGEVPYHLITHEGRTRIQPVAGKLTDVGLLPREGVRATVRLDEGKPHSTLRIITPRGNFQSRVTVETSQDGIQWGIVRKDGQITRSTTDARVVESLSVTYPVSTLPFLRVTIAGWDDASALGGIAVDQETPVLARRVTLAEVKAGATSSRDGRTSYEFALDANLPMIDGATLLVGAGEFSRPSRLRLRGLDEHWQDAYADLTQLGPRRQFAFRFALGRYDSAHLMVTDGDNPPLPVEGLQLSVTARTVVFVAAQAGPYWLYYGNRKAAWPAYDTSAIERRQGLTTPQTARLGAPESNPAFAPPFSDRYPYVLYSAVVAAVALMGLLGFRMLRALPASAGG